jgi:predicted TPR repeat methyltransferase
MNAMGNAKEFFLSGIDLFSRGQFPEAEHHFRKSLEIEPGRFSPLLNLAVSLLNQNKLDQAEEICRTCLALEPRSSAVHLNLGLIFRSKGDPNTAIAYLQKATEIDGLYDDNWYQSGLCLSELRQFENALNCFEKVLSLNPDHEDAMRCIGLLFVDMKKNFVAMACFEKAIMSHPTNGDTYISKAWLHHKLEQIDAAIVCFEQALKLKHPSSKMIEFIIVSLKQGAMPKEPPKEYVASLFDSYAAKFEQHLVGGLKYESPTLLFSKAKDYLKENSDILDLGCGTGLMGPLLAEKAKTLIGVDLSQKMLDMAKSKGIYEKLVHSDINDFLDGRDGEFDAVVAADVFVYVGDLTQTFANIYRALRPGGIFAFTVERFEGEGFSLNKTMRYSHSSDYCLALASQHRFAVKVFATDFLRNEKGAPDGKITGHYFALQKQAA